MSSGSPLDNWRFLLGKWKSKTETANQFGEKGIVEGETVFTLEPSEKFIMSVGESRSEGRLLNKAVSILFYDPIAQKFRRKTFFSYGFVNNEVESSKDNREIVFDVTMEPLPKQFEGTRWRSFMRKISDTKVAVGLEVAKGAEEFKGYGETILTKVA